MAAADDFRDFALRLAAAARAETLPRWQSAGAARDKAGAGARFDPVTEADVAAESAMRALIEREFPDHGIAGEEFDDRPANGRYVWSLDPIDGTRSFLCGLPTWVTLVALLEDGKPILGLIDAPRLGETYIGHAGAAELCSAQDMAPLRTSRCMALAEARLSTTDPLLFAGAEHAAFERLRTRARTTRYGHDGYAYARLAAGSLDLVVESGLQPYDYNALVPVIRAAGGAIGNWHGADDFTEGKVIAAASQALFDEAVAVLGT